MLTELLDCRSSYRMALNLSYIPVVVFMKHCLGILSAYKKAFLSEDYYYYNAD